MNLNKLSRKAVRSMRDIQNVTSLTMEEMKKILGREWHYCGGSLSSCYDPNHHQYIDDCPERRLA
jgi:hypothetical protein